jgi:hypothetical protein
VELLARTTSEHSHQIHEHSGRLPTLWKQPPGFCILLRYTNSALRVRKVTNSKYSVAHGLARINSSIPRFEWSVN